jgi:uncharacterized protein with HEPN domain
MTDKERKYLSDILVSIDHILSFTNDVVYFEQYTENFLIKSAVERHLSIIGEAVNKFLKESLENELLHSRQIISSRNRLVHSYDNIDDRIIWTILSQYIIPLKEEVEKKIR